MLRVQGVDPHFVIPRNHLMIVDGTKLGDLHSI